MENILTPEQTEMLKSKVSDALLKRGLPSEFITFKETQGERGVVLDVQTAKFQTTPVLFKTLCVASRGGSVEKYVKETGLIPNTIKDVTFSLVLEYTSFSDSEFAMLLMTVNASFIDDSVYPNINIQ